MTPHQLRCSSVMLSFAFAVSVQAAPTLLEDYNLITVEGQRQILSAPVSPSIGSATPDVTIVEYFDYNCPYCKQLVPTLKALLESDIHVALVYKDWPILSTVSLYAAQCALAAKWQNKYIQAHDALIKGPRLSQNGQVDALLRQAGVDMTRLEADRERHAGSIDALLNRDEEEARALGLRGTPGILVGRQLVSGIADLATLQSLVANARQ